MTVERINNCFKTLKEKNHTAFIPFITAGHPTLEKTAEVLDRLPHLGVDMIELGIPFSDPMADGPTIQAASVTALKNGVTIHDVLQLVTTFRKTHPAIPIILMGYYNPIYQYGCDAFVSAALSAGVDGLIVVDLPPEHDHELCITANTNGLSFIRLITPSTSPERLPKILSDASGFLYYVSVLGITGQQRPDFSMLDGAITSIRSHTPLPIGIGFGVQSVTDINAITPFSDAVIVGSSIVKKIEYASSRSDSFEPIYTYIKEMATACHTSPK